MVDVIIVYDTLHGFTEKVANIVLEGAKASGADAVMKRTEDVSENDLAGPAGIILGSPNINNGITGRMRGLIDGPLKGIGGSAKVGAAFGTHKWSDGNLLRLEQEMLNRHVRLVAPGVNATRDLNEETMKRLRSLGDAVGREALRSKGKQ